jgi:transposase-like protein
MNPKPVMKKYTFKDFQRQFPDDATCLEWLRNRLYPDGIMCKLCGVVTKHHRVASRPSYSCDQCGHHVHPTADTIFHKSPTPLTTWFYAIYLMSSTRCGISAKQIERETGVTYKTAWRMFKKIREMLSENVKVSGGIEADETYMGGKDRNKHVGKRKSGVGRSTGTKTPVFGMVERKGCVVARVTPDTKARTVFPIMAQHVLPATTIFTDDYPVYDGISAMGKGYIHNRVNHTAKVYVVGNCHTNTIEGFWSLLKRGIAGVYHAVSAKYLQSYCDEYTFRYNRRFDTQPMFTSFLYQIQKALPGESLSEDQTQSLAG